MINIVFPIAGDGSRFNYQFKPFIKISDITFIEYAVKSFTQYLHLIDTFYFIFRRDQEQKFNVTENLSKLFLDLKIKCVIIENKTDGPAQTIQEFLKITNLNGQSIICDCDHYVDSSELFKVIAIDDKSEMILSLWNIDTSEYNSWGKIFLYNGLIDKISEKQIHSDKSYEIFGIIGCTYFKDIQVFNQYDKITYISDILNDKISNINYCYILKADFFGDPKRKEQYINNSREEKCLFIDLDGTLIRHEANPSYEDGEQILLPNTIEKINQFKDICYYIIITIERKKNVTYIKNLLDKLKIKYDRIISDIPSGPRILINDIKPSRPFYEMAKQINLIRDHGIQNINIVYDNVEVIKTFKGGSFSKTILIKKNNTLVVRKFIYKNSDNIIHYRKLKKQYIDLKNINFLIPNITPNLYEDFENDFLYYYDMEYLDKYKSLFEVIDKDIYLNKLLEILKNNLYSFRKINTDDQWLKKYFDRKINLQFYKSLDPKIKHLIELEKLNINGISYFGLEKCLEIINYSELSPKYLSHIHGDLTYENILVDEQSGDIKIIDMDGADYIDAIELDLGKLSQSIISKYEIWSNDVNIITFIDEHTIKCNEYSNNFYDGIEKIKNQWIQILECDSNIFYKKYLIYMAIHLFRMVPFRYKISVEQALYAIKDAIVCLNNIIN